MLVRERPLALGEQPGMMSTHKHALTSQLPGLQTRMKQAEKQTNDTPDRAPSAARHARQRTTNEERAGRRAVQQGPQRSTGM